MKLFSKFKNNFRQIRFFFLAAAFIYAVLFSGSLSANEMDETDAEIIRKGSWGLGFYGAGGTGVSGSTQGTEVVWTGLRYKRVVSDVMGKGFWRGSLEYGAEFMPVFLIFQDEVVYGTQFSPLLMRWNFQKRGSHILPFFEWGGGLLFTAEQVPVRSSNFNFTPQGGFGFSIFNSSGGAVTFQLKYMHISNGGFKKPNPGINSVQVLAGYEWLR
jgi:hypothetical protein